jgi:hypothetical protein
MSAYTYDQVKTYVTAILELREAGFKYREIDAILVLPRRAYLIVNGDRAKFVIANENELIPSVA